MSQSLASLVYAVAETAAILRMKIYSYWKTLFYWRMALQFLRKMAFHLLKIKEINNGDNKDYRKENFGAWRA